MGQLLDDGSSVMDVIAGWERNHPDVPVHFSFRRFIMFNKATEPKDPSTAHLLCHQVPLTDLFVIYIPLREAFFLKLIIIVLFRQLDR